MKKLKKLFSGNSLLLTSIVLLLLLIVFFGVSYVTETPATIKDLRITNISDTSLAVTYFTETPSFGSVILSDKNDFNFFNQLSKTRYYDDRNDGELRYSHHVTVSGLKPSSAYFFKVMGNLKDVKYTYPILETGKTLDTLVTPDPTYGSFSDNTSIDSIVYLSLDGSTLQSTYLGTGNTFSMDKANIRTPDLEDQATYKYNDQILIEILNNETQLAYQTNVGSDQPTAKFETTANKETSKVKLNTSVLGSVFAEAACSAATLTLGEKTTCTGPNGYQYVVKDGKFSDEIARMQDYYVQTGITGSKDFTEQGKIDAAKGNNQGPFSPTNPAPIPVNAKLPLCSNDDKSVKVGEPCRGAQNGLTYTRTATGFDDTIAKAQNADKNLLFTKTAVVEVQEGGLKAGKQDLTAEQQNLCKDKKNSWVKKDATTIYFCTADTYVEYKCKGDDVVSTEAIDGNFKCGKIQIGKELCRSGRHRGDVLPASTWGITGDDRVLVMCGTGNDDVFMILENPSNKPAEKVPCTSVVYVQQTTDKRSEFNKIATGCVFDKDTFNESKDQPNKDTVPTGSGAPKTDGPTAGGVGGGKGLATPASGDVAGYYNLNYKDCETTAKTFDPKKITKTCGCGLIPDTDQNSGMLTLNVNDKIVYKCVGDENGKGVITPYDHLANIVTIPIGILNKDGVLEIKSSGIPSGTVTFTNGAPALVVTETTYEEEVPNSYIKDSVTCKETVIANGVSCCKNVEVIGHHKVLVKDKATNKEISSKDISFKNTEESTTSTCSGKVLKSVDSSTKSTGNCGPIKDGEPWCAEYTDEKGKVNQFQLAKCTKGVIQYLEGNCTDLKVSIINKSFISPVNAEAVLGVSDSNGIEVNSTGTYSITSGNTSIKEFKVMDLVNGKAKIVFFDDKNANGIRDTGEEDITTPVEVKIEKTSDISRFDLNEGWNLVGYEYTEARTAKDLLSNISSNGGYATHVATYRQGGWVMYSERAEKSFGTNFNLVPGEGYFVKVIKSGKLSFEGKKIESNQPYRLSNGWNLLSFRLDPVLKASKLIDAINLNTPVSSDVITRYVSGKYENVVKDKDTVYGNDFDIEENKGYFVRTTKGGVVIMK